MANLRKKGQYFQVQAGSTQKHFNTRMLNDDTTPNKTESSRPGQDSFFPSALSKSVCNQSLCKPIQNAKIPTEIAPIAPVQSQLSYMRQQHQEQLQCDLNSAVIDMQSQLNQNNSGTESFIIANSDNRMDSNLNAFSLFGRGKKSGASSKETSAQEASNEEDPSDGENITSHGAAKGNRKKNKGGNTQPVIEQTLVEIKIVFVRVLDIDTMNQQFEAEIYVQARWTESQFAGYSEEQLQNVEFNQCWNPMLTISNSYGPLETDRASMLLRYEPERVYPVVTYMWHVDGVFRESMELQHFPFDVQEISIVLSSGRDLNEVELVCDYNHLSNVSPRAMQGNQEWTAYRHVQFTRDFNTSETVSTTRHPILVATAHIKRKLGFYFWNIFIIVILILALSFTILGIEPYMEERLMVTITLFLTCIAFKLVVRSTIPQVSYLTYLDIYVVFALIFLAIQAVENSIMLHLKRFKSVDKIKLYDEIAQSCLIGLLVIFHLAFMIYIQVTAFSRRRSMRRKDANFQLTKVNLNKKEEENPLFKQTQTSDSLLATLKSGNKDSLKVNNPLYNPK